MTKFADPEDRNQDCTGSATVPHSIGADLSVEGALRRHVETLAATPRNLEHYRALQHAEAYIAAQFSAAGYAPSRHEFEAVGRRIANIEAERPGTTRPDRTIAIGSHYDSIGFSPGANDNASGVAALLELARLHALSRPGDSTVRFVAFVNEEPPYFMTDTMGASCMREGWPRDANRSPE